MVGKLGKDLKKWPRHATHGDLNLNNILWNGSEIKFLDFEDVPHSFLHPIFDIILIFERVLFCDAKLQKKQIVDLARQFLLAILLILICLMNQRHRHLMNWQWVCRSDLFYY